MFGLGKHCRAHGSAVALVVGALAITVGALKAQEAASLGKARTAEEVAGEALRSSDAEPLWEIGLGAIGAVGPDYPASASYGGIALPLPLLVYRGDLFRFGGDRGAQIVPLRTDRLELGLSIDIAPGAQSDDSARDGLPDLDPLLEVGPELAVRGAQMDLGSFGGGVLEFALQTRVAVSADIDAIDVTYRGIAVEPQIRYAHQGAFGEGSALDLRRTHIRQRGLARLLLRGRPTVRSHRPPCIRR